MKASNLSDFVCLSDLENPQKRFRKICKIRDKRLKEPLCSSRRMQDVCEQIPPEFGNNDGYHRGCSQRFTMNISRLKVISKPRKKQKERLPRRDSIEGKDKTLFLPNCLFCKRYGRTGVKKQNVWTSEGLTNYKREGGPTIIKIHVAEKKAMKNF